MPNQKTPFLPGSKVVAYLRDSGHEEQDLSIAQQESVIREHCQANGLLLIRVFADYAAPGSSTVGRTQFHEMINYFQSSDCQAKGLIIWKYNRFARDIDDAQFYKAILRRKKYIIYSLNDSIPEGLDGRLFEAAVDWMNARYLEDMRVDIMRGQRHMVEQYGVIGGTPPRGFKREMVTTSTHRDGRPHIVSRWVPDPDMIEKIRTAWRMRSAGKSYAEIHAATHIYKSNNNYTEFFRNKIYLGTLVFGDQVIENYCEPIIDQATWDVVQLVQAKSTRAVTLDPNHPRRRKSTFILSGLVYCAQCGSMLYGEVVQFRTTPDHRYEYYACSGQNRRNGCTMRKVPRAILENVILEQLSESFLSPKAVEARFKLEEQRVEQTNKEYKSQIAGLKKDLRSVQRKIENITETIADQGKKAPRSLMAKLESLEEEETNIQENIAKAEQLKPESPRTLEQMLQQAQFFQLALASTEEGKINRILRALIHRITVDTIPEENKLVGNLACYEIPITSETGSETDPAALFMRMTLCPGRDSNSQPRR